MNLFWLFDFDIMKNKIILWLVITFILAILLPDVYEMRKTRKCSRVVRRVRIHKKLNMAKVSIFIAIYSFDMVGYVPC